MTTTSFQVIKSAEELRAATERVQAYEAIGLDTETTSLDPYKGQLRLVQLSTPKGAAIVDLKHFGDSRALAENSDLRPLRELLKAPHPVKIAHNAKFDAKWIQLHLGVEPGKLFDTLLASQLISGGDPDERHGLDAVVPRYLDQTIDKAQRLSDWSSELSEAQLEYAARDAAVLLPLRERLIERLTAEDLRRCAQLEFECVVPVATVELTGFYLDEHRWREQMVRVERERTRLAEELQEMLSGGASQGLLFAGARSDINLDSHTQLTDALRRLGVPVPDSTRNWKLQPLARDYPVIGKLLEYRTVQKAMTSYGENIIHEIDPVTRRIHADFRQIGAPTGRMSCTNPNIQQVPHAVEYRRCFRAPEGRKLIIADYSQVELRILAHISEDPGFIEAFNSGADLHRVTAAQVFGVAPDDVTPDQRSFAKRLNFGVVYGIGAQRFSLMTGLSLSESEDVLRRYFATYRKLDAWLREAARRAVRDRVARTLANRLARFKFDPQDRQAIAFVHRSGMNMPIQGTSADILKRALRLLHDRLSDTRARVVNIVHDEIVVESDAAEAPEVARVLAETMCAAGEEFVTRVPIKVETEIADEWVK